MQEALTYDSNVFNCRESKNFKNIVYLKSENEYPMTTIELKKQLIHQISEIDDESFLQAIKTILDSKTQSQVVTLTEAQRWEINESKKQIEEGEFIEQADLDQKFSQWQSSK